MAQSNPLRIRFDGDSAVLAATPICLGPKPSNGARVWVQIYGTQLVIHGTAAYPFAQDSGVTTFGNFNGSMSYGHHVNFHDQAMFTVPPTVTTTLNSAPGGSATLVPRAINITTTGFDAYMYSVDGNPARTNSSDAIPLPVSWQAMQRTATSAS